MNKITIKQFIIFSSVLFILNGASVLASPPAPTPLCQITGVIKSVTFKDAYDEPCLKEPYGCPTDMELHHPARYYLDVNINSVSYISGETNFNTCSNMYPVGSVKNIFIAKDKVKVGDTFSSNKEIEGVVQSFWGSSFDWYNLTTEVTKPIKQEDGGQQKSILETSQISEKLIGENYINKVDNISLKRNKQTYEVTASKNGKLFFFIPINLSFQITVDATSGEVKEIKKPWWTFLVRY